MKMQHDDRYFLNEVLYIYQVSVQSQLTGMSLGWFSLRSSDRRPPYTCTVPALFCWISRSLEQNSLLTPASEWTADSFSVLMSR